MLSLGKFKPSLGISALKKCVSESRISQKYDDLGVSDFENLDLGVSEFENVDIEISPMGHSIFYPQAYPKREIKKFTPAGTTIDKIMVLIQNQCFGMSGKVFVVTPAKARALLFLVVRLELGFLWR